MSRRLHDSVRNAALVQARKMPPGRERAEMVRELGFLPNSEDTGIRDPRRVAARGRRDPLWAQFREMTRRDLIASVEPFTIDLPGLRLATLNAALRGGHTNAEGQRTGAIAVQTRAKHDVRAAFYAAGIPRYRAAMRVALDVLQFGPSARIDSGNLYHKPLVDALVDLHILADDAPRYVGDITTGHREADEHFVRVVVRPEPSTTPEEGGKP